MSNIELYEMYVRIYPKISQLIDEQFIRNAQCMAFQMLLSFSLASKAQHSPDFLKKSVTDVPLNLLILMSFSANELISCIASVNRITEMWTSLKQNELEGMHTADFQYILTTPKLEAEEDVPPWLQTEDHQTWTLWL